MVKINIFCSYVSDATAAILVTCFLFMMPDERPNWFCWRGGPGNGKPGPRKALVRWEDVVHKVPWGLILLLGGGFALAENIKVCLLASIYTPHY